MANEEALVLESIIIPVEAIQCKRHTLRIEHRVPPTAHGDEKESKDFQRRKCIEVVAAAQLRDEGLVLHVAGS